MNLLVNCRNTLVFLVLGCLQLDTGHISTTVFKDFSQLPNMPCFSFINVFSDNIGCSKNGQNHIMWFKGVKQDALFSINHISKTIWSCCLNLTHGIFYDVFL